MGTPVTFGSPHGLLQEMQLTFLLAVSAGQVAAVGCFVEKRTQCLAKNQSNKIMCDVLCCVVECNYLSLQ